MPFLLATNTATKLKVMLMGYWVRMPTTKNSPIKGQVRHLDETEVLAITDKLITDWTNSP